jgi:hypothetical protein
MNENETELTAELISTQTTTERVIQIFTAIGTAVALILLSLGYISAPADDNEPTARGVTNFDSLTLSDDLVVGGSMDVTGATTFGSGDLYPLLIDDSSEAIYVTQSTFTGTEVITSSAHGLTAITAAGCTLGESPATGAGDGALCWVEFASETLTVTVEQDDWVTDATNSTIVDYWVAGTP